MSEVHRPDEEALRRDLLRYARLCWERGWVANHDGNLSARLGDGRFLCTPTAVSKGDVTAESLIVVNAACEVISGSRRAFSELKLHIAAYAARPDIGVVLHAHPPASTAFAVAGVEIGHPFLAEAVVTLGPELPVVPFHLPGEPALEAALGQALAKADVVVLDRHGLLSVGGNLEQAWLRMELVEHLARISAQARALGGVRPLSADQVRSLTAKGRPASSPSFGPAPERPSPSRWAGAGAAAEAPGERQDLRAAVASALRNLGG